MDESTLPLNPLNFQVKQSSDINLLHKTHISEKQNPNLNSFSFEIPEIDKNKEKSIMYFKTVNSFGFDSLLKNDIDSLLMSSLFDPDSSPAYNIFKKRKTEDFNKSTHDLSNTETTHKTKQKSSNKKRSYHFSTDKLKLNYSLFVNQFNDGVQNKSIRIKTPNKALYRSLDDKSVFVFSNFKTKKSKTKSDIEKETKLSHLMDFHINLLVYNQTKKNSFEKFVGGFYLPST